MKELKRKYNLVTTISLVVGIVMGSGIFLKNIPILRETGGSVLLSTLIFIIVGLIMIISSYTFSLASRRIEKVNGIIDYIEDSNGNKASYYVGFYYNFVYLPIITSVLAFLSASFFNQLIGLNSNLFLIVFGIFLLTLSFIINIFLPRFAGKIQVSTTIIKLIPILIIGTIGLILGIKSNNEVIIIPSKDSNINFFSAILKASFAYEGWIIATTVNAEVLDSKKNLPKALIIGSIIVVISYIIYNIGIVYLVGSNTILNSLNDQKIIELAFINLFHNKIGGKIFLLFIFISCVGVLNGLSMATSRGMYSLAVRNYIYKSKKFNKLNNKTNTSISSGILGFILSLLFYFYFVIAIIYNKVSSNIDEICIALLYVSYIFIYINIMKKYKDLNKIKRYFIPILAIISSLFLIYSSFNVLFTTLLNNNLSINQRIPYILIIIFINFLIARLLYNKNN